MKFSISFATNHRKVEPFTIYFQPFFKKKTKAFGYVPQNFRQDLGVCWEYRPGHSGNQKPG